MCRAQHCAKCRGDIRISNDSSCPLSSPQCGSGLVVCALLVLTHLNTPKPSEMGVVIPILPSSEQAVLRTHLVCRGAGLSESGARDQSPCSNAYSWHMMETDVYMTKRIEGGDLRVKEIVGNNIDKS